MFRTQWPACLTQATDAVRVGARSDGHSSVLETFRGCHAYAAVAGGRVTRFVVEFDDGEQREHYRIFNSFRQCFT